MSTIRAYAQTDISADTGEVVAIAGQLINSELPDPGFREDIVTLRLRLKVNTPQDPYAGGSMLATVRWHDGNVVQEWNLALPTDVDQYVEQGMDVWMDGSRDLTIQVRPLVSGGSVDVLLDYVEL